jgi:methyl-accepting chemotaxis protein
MPRQAERTLPKTFDSFTDVRVSVDKTKSPSYDDNIIFDNDNNLDKDTRDRLGLLRRSDHFVDGHKNSITVSAGGGMRQGKPFSSLSTNHLSSYDKGDEGAIFSSEQSQQTSEMIAAQDEALNKLSANLGRLQSVSAEITSEMTAQEVVVQEVSVIAERSEDAVNVVTRQVENIVKKFNAESLVPKVICVLVVVVLLEFLYLLYF